MANATGRKLQQPTQTAPKTEPDHLIDTLIEEWKFFIPEPPVVRKILALREKLGDSYLEHEYQSFEKQATELESHPDLQEASEVLEKSSSGKGLLQQLVDQVSTIFGFANGGDESRKESVALYQSFISETIYDHLAMLGRSPGTMKGHAFSIRQELTEGIAEEIGLGLYLDPEISDDLHNRSEIVLLQLAGEYQEWLLDEQQGTFETTWGYICSSDKELTQEMRDSHPLILIPDVATAAAAA